jgi:hydrogenase nickel incorporation protein HypB
MCGICGCDTATAVDHDRRHDLPREHVYRPMADLLTVDPEARLLARNDALAADSRAWFKTHSILALNLVGSPGSGKTSLLVRTINDLGDSRPAYVIGSDQETSRDAELIRETGAQAVELHTGAGCHVDAARVSRGIAQLAPADGGLVLIENVENLVSPALFDLGEAAKVAILSVADGDDKPLKYPDLFRAADLLLLSKIDLLPHVDFNVLAAIAHARQVNNELTVLCVSAKTGEGMAAWYAWIGHKMSRSRPPLMA